MVKILPLGTHGLRKKEDPEVGGHESSDRSSLVQHSFMSSKSGYEVIGKALLHWEDVTPYCCGFAFAQGSRVREQEFQHQVCVMSVELLEAFLEHLLDESIPEESLFIKRSSIFPRLNWFALGGGLSSIGIGLYLSSTGSPWRVTFPLTLLLAAPFMVLWHFSPGSGLARRVSFARIVSREIARRRGDDDSVNLSSPISSREQLLNAILGRDSALRGAAFCPYRTRPKLH